MNKVAVISAGSNTTDREFRVQQAIEFLLSNLTHASASSVYESPAHNGKDAPYFNAVVVGVTDLSLDDFKAKLKQYEADSGRDEITRIEGIVPIDLDIVMWDGRIIRENDFERPYFNRGYRELLTAGAFEI